MIKKKYLLTIVSIMLCFAFIPAISRAYIDLSVFEQYTGEAENDGAGTALSTAGDVNGDGYNDFLIGASSYNSSAGAAYLVYGSAAQLTGGELTDTEIVKFSGEVAWDMLGAALSSAGDINNDGYDDLLIATTGKNSNAGSVYLVYGQAEKYTSLSPSNSSVIEFTGESGSDLAGSALSSAGDVNADGYDDFLISSSGNSDAATFAGAVYLIYGQADTFNDTDLGDISIVKISGAAENDSLATGLSSGDINGDGYSDLIISSSSVDNSKGAFYIIYGRAETLTSMSISDSSIVKFTGENNADNAGGTIESGADVNGDGYDDILVGAILNDDGGISAGAAYLVYGQAETLSAGSLGDSGFVKFTGEEAGDLAGIDLSILEDVNNDGYADLLIGASMNDEIASNAGAAYLIYGQDEVLSSLDLSDSSITKFTGENESDIAADVISTAGDVNGDGFSDVLVSAYAHDEVAQDEGVIYLGYLYIDEDGDGVAGDSGLFSGDDCDDSDEYINPDALEVQDEVDNNCDDIIDEINTGTHPNFGEYDPADSSLHDDVIVSVVGDVNGNIKVTYIDDSLFEYNIFNITDIKLTKVKHYRDTGYYLVLHPQGKKIALVNIYNGEVLNKKVLNNKNTYKNNSVKVFKLRNKYWSVVTSKKKNGQARLAVVRIKISKEEFGKKISVKTKNVKIKPSKTKKIKNKLKLRNKNNKLIKQYLFTQKFNLKK